MFFAHQLVELIVEVADLVIAEGGLLDPRRLARDLLDHLASPFLACRYGIDFGDELRTARSAGVDNSQVRCLCFAETKQHGLRLF